MHVKFIGSSRSPAAETIKRWIMSIRPSNSRFTTSWRHWHTRHELRQRQTTYRRPDSAHTSGTRMSLWSASRTLLTVYRTVYRLVHSWQYTVDKKDISKSSFQHMHRCLGTVNQIPCNRATALQHSRLDWKHVYITALFNFSYDQ